MATLDRAFAFAQMNVVAVVVRENLYLDVPRTDDRLLDINSVITKTRESFGLRILKRQI